MIINVVFNTRKEVDIPKVYQYIYSTFGKDVLICCPYLHFQIEGYPDITSNHRLMLSLKSSEVIVYICGAYHDASSTNRIIRALEMKNNNVYNVLAKQLQ